MPKITKRRLLKRAAALCCALLLCGQCTAHAQMWYTPPEDQAAPASAQIPAGQELSCKSAILMEMSTGSVLYEMNADERLPEASITKIMTMLLVFEALDSGRLSFNEQVTCSEYAASMGGSQIWLEPGETMSVHELIKAVFVGSANDAAVALAEHIAGSHESFVALMNARAAELGMTGTAYKNCTGLDAPGHLTTARDIAIASCELLRHDSVKEYSTIWMDSLRGGELELVNTNKLVRYYSGITGLKTGTTSQAGCCVAATAERDGMPLVAVILGAPNSKSRFADASRLLDMGYAACELLPIASLEVELPELAVKKGMEKSVPLCADLSGGVVIPKGRRADITTAVDIAPEVTAPVEYGQIAGTVTVSLDGEPLGVYNILTDNQTRKITFVSVFSLLIDGLLQCDLSGSQQ